MAEATGRGSSASGETTVQVYARSPALADRIARSLAEVADVRVVRKWRQLLSGPDRGASVVFGAASPPDSSVARRLTAIRTARRRSALILVSPRNPDAVRRVSGVRIDAVIWLDEVEERLAASVRKAHRLTPLRRLAAAISESRGIPIPLRDALLLACRPSGPVRSVGELSKAVDRDRRTLSRQWRTFVGSGHRLTLQTLLGWLTLLKAVGGKSPARSWEAVARDTGVSIRTIRRLSRRHTSEPLSRWEGREPELLFRRLLETDGGEALARALGEPESGADPLI